MQISQQLSKNFINSLTTTFPLALLTLWGQAIVLGASSSLIFLGFILTKKQKKTKKKTREREERERDL